MPKIKTSAATSSDKQKLPAKPKQAQVPSTVTRSDGREVSKLHVYVPTSLAAELRMHCARTGLDQSDVVTEALTTILARAAKASGAAKPSGGR